MTAYIVKESFIYGGKIQNIGEEVQILEKDVIENCIDRGLIEKKDNKKADTNDILKNQLKQKILKKQTRKIQKIRKNR